MKRCLSPLLWLGFAIAACATLRTAQRTSVIPLVPAADWRLENSRVLALDAVREWGGEPEVDREYGVRTIEHRTYQLYDISAEVIVEEASDPSAAYGLITFYQTETMSPENGMQLTLSGPDGALMGRGRFFIRVPRLAATGSRLSENNFRALLIFVGGTRSSSDVLGKLPAPMPTTGLVPGSEKYILGPVVTRRVLPTFRTDLIGFSQGAEMQTAIYQAGKSRATVLAITYPTPQIARVRFGAMEKFLAVNQDNGPSSIYGRRNGSFLFLVLGADSAAWASQLMDQFNVSQSVSWHQRYPGNEPIWVQAAELILANLLLVCILVGLAVVGGVLIFLSRKAAAKWFPKSAWGHPGEETIIRLNLS